MSTVIATLTSGESGANSLTDINSNFSSLNTNKIETSVIDTTVTLGTSDAKLPSQNAVKTYVDSRTSQSTSGVSVGPSTSSTQTITHGLGKIPAIIRLNGIGSANHASYSSRPFCFGTYTNSGNKCILSNTTAENAPTSSSTYAISISSAGTIATGIVQNLTATTFDIVWTAAGDTSGATYFLWEAQ